MSAVLAVVGVLVGGAVGSLVRHEVVSRAGAPGTRSRAAAVAVVNLAGAALVAAVLAAEPPAVWTAVLAVGLAGSLTTFSTWVVDAVLAADAGRPLTLVAVVDLVGQLAVGTGIVLVVLRLG